MRRKLGFATGLIAVLALGSAAPSSSTGTLSDEAFAALDPTRPGRLACRGLGSSIAALDARLRLAAARDGGGGADTRPIGLVPGVGRSDIPLGAISPEARRYFDQGIAFTYGFNHRAAIRSFRRAQEVDPGCAMCWWGVALANGPNINAGIDEGQSRDALHALKMARQLSKGADPRVTALIDAQAARYSDDPAASRAALDQAYARAILAIAAANPDSDDLAVLAAEAAMNTSPWNYWTENGEPRPLIPEAVGLIERVMARTPTHPQASHLYIHLLELPEPEKAEAAADRLRATGPRALGHLVHMPAHIYYRLGRYADSLAANIDAVAADEAYLREVGDDGLVRYGYYPHNVHFLLTSAQLMGDMRTVANQAARLEAILDAETGRDIYWIQAIYAAPYFAYAQYGSPDATLALTAAPHPLDYVEAMRHYARAVAYAQKRDRAAFAKELAALESRSGSPAIAEMEAGGFPAETIIRLAAEVARGRLAMAQSSPKDAIAHFERAAELQKQIPYNEPPNWYYPVSQSLGAALYRAGRYADAEQAFRTALFEAPNSALALYGLGQTQRKLGRKREAQATDRAFRAVWKGEDGWLDMGRI